MLLSHGTILSCFLSRHALHALTLDIATLSRLGGSGGFVLCRRCWICICSWRKPTPPSARAPCATPPGCSLPCPRAPSLVRIGRARTSNLSNTRTLSPFLAGTPSRLQVEGLFAAARAPSLLVGRNPIVAYHGKLLGALGETHCTVEHCTKSRRQRLDDDVVVHQLFLRTRARLTRHPKSRAMICCSS